MQLKQLAKFLKVADLFHRGLRHKSAALQFDANAALGFQPAQCFRDGRLADAQLIGHSFSGPLGCRRAFASRETARDASMTNRRLQFSPWRREEKIRFTLLISCILHFTEYEERLPIRRRTARAEVLLPHTRLL